MATQLWLPTDSRETFYDSLDRPAAVSMYYAADNNTFTHEYTDFLSGNKVNFGRTLSGSDNKIRNLQDCWGVGEVYGLTHGYCKLDNYISWHIGAIPELHPLADIRSFEQHLLPGRIGVRFEYRWPNNNDRNYWSNSPVFINDMMLHYYNTSGGVVESYETFLTGTSVTEDYLKPDRYVDNNNRRSNTWKGCYWKPSSAACDRIRDQQLMQIGMSVEMKYASRGSASHSRCMDIKNLTPIWSKASAAKCAPVLAKPAPYVWTRNAATRSTPFEFYSV